MVVYYRGQNYSKIKKACLAKGELFDDSEFPASSKSIFYDKVDQSIVWKRPKELCKAPRLVVDGSTYDDLVTGELKSTWFITACSALAHGSKMFQKNNEFWSALLEKAYAKLFGDYQSLCSGRTSDALVDFTGGVAEKILISSFNREDEKDVTTLFKKLEAAYENKSLINCVIDVPDEEIGQDGPEGLVLGQGYNVTMVKFIEIKKALRSQLGDNIFLVRLFNPWSGREWNGPWSDESEELGRLPQQEWEKMGISFQKDGEFCIVFGAFLKHFTSIDVCHFVNTSFFTLKKAWNESLFYGEWKIAGRIGGNDPKSVSFLANPQFMFDLPTQGYYHDFIATRGCHRKQGLH